MITDSLLLLEYLEKIILELFLPGVIDEDQGIQPMYIKATSIILSNNISLKYHVNISKFRHVK